MSKSFTPLQIFGKILMILKLSQKPFVNGRFVTGFTLIELLVVTAIVILLTALITPNYKAGQLQLSLQRSAAKLAQDLRRAQEMAMNSKEIGKGIVPPGEEFYPEGGYGIYFNISNPTYYSLFADCDGDLKFQSGNRCGPPGSEFPELIEDIPLGSGVEMTHLFPFSPLHITFQAPDPTVSIQPDDSQATVELNGIRTILVNKAGLITIK